MYKRAKDLMDEYQIGRSTVHNILQEMQDLKRYPASAIVGGTCKRVDADAFQDYMENRDLLKHPNMRKYVPEYRKGKL